MTCYQKLHSLHFLLRHDAARGALLCRHMAQAALEAKSYMLGPRAAVLMLDMDAGRQLPDYAFDYAQLIGRPLRRHGIEAENICWLYCDTTLRWRGYEIRGHALKLIELPRPTPHGATDYACDFLRLFSEKPLDMLLFALARQPFDARAYLDTAPAPQPPDTSQPHEIHHG